MLARAALILALVPTLALAASGSITVPPASTAPAAPTAAAPLPALAPPAIAPADPSDCRIGCASDRYMCEATDHPESCPGTWSQCVATCDAPNLQQGVSTAP